MEFAAESVVDLMNGLIVSGGVSTVFISSMMSFLTQMINPLQIIFHLPAINYNYPGNAMEFFSIIVPIVNYDVLENIPVYTNFLH